MVASFLLKKMNTGTEHRWYSHTEQMEEILLKDVLQLAGQGNLCINRKHIRNSLQCDEENRLLQITKTFSTVCYLTMLSTVKIMWCK